MQQVFREYHIESSEIHDHMDGLIAHALLHVLGYDHMEQVEGKEWEDLQNMIQSMMGSD